MPATVIGQSSTFISPQAGQATGRLRTGERAEPTSDEYHTGASLAVSSRFVDFFIIVTMRDFYSGFMPHPGTMELAFGGTLRFGIIPCGRKMFGPCFPI